MPARDLDRDTTRAPGGARAEAFSRFRPAMSARLFAAPRLVEMDGEAMLGGRGDDG